MRDAPAIKRIARGARPALEPATLSVRFLSRPRPSFQTGWAPPRELSLRHAEILLLLTLHPHGLTAEQLTFHLYGDEGKIVSTRAEICRLRRMLGAHLAARPYRLRGPVETDVEQIERHAAAGEVASVLRAYPGELLPESENPRVRQMRRELHWTVQRAAIDAGVDELWAWLSSSVGREDLDGLRAFLDRAEARDLRRGLAAARLRSLEGLWDLACSGA